MKNIILNLSPIKKSILRIYFYILVFGFAYYLWGTLTDLWLPCMTKTITGLDCPGCGVSRMCLAILRLDFKSAFLYNPPVFVGLIEWNIIAVIAFTEKVKFFNNQKVLNTLMAITVGSMCLFGVIRNIIPPLI